MNLMTGGNQSRHQLLADRSRRSCHKHLHHQLLDRGLPAPTRQHGSARCDTSEHPGTGAGTMAGASGTSVATLGGRRFWARTRMAITSLSWPHWDKQVRSAHRQLSIAYQFGRRCERSSPGLLSWTASGMNRVKKFSNWRNGGHPHRSIVCLRGRLRHQLAMQIAAEISELMQPAHCWPKNSGSVHISADVAPINQPSRFRPDRYWPMKPTSTAPKPTTCHAAFMAGISEFRPLCCRCEARTSAWHRPSLPMTPHQDGSLAVPPIQRSTLMRPLGPRTMLTSGCVVWMHRICDRLGPWPGGEF